MSDIPNDDKPGFVAEKPEHCFACYRLIHKTSESPSRGRIRQRHLRNSTVLQCH